MASSWGTRKTTRKGRGTSTASKRQDGQRRSGKRRFKSGIKSGKGDGNCVIRSVAKAWQVQEQDHGKSAATEGSVEKDAMAISRAVAAVPVTRMISRSMAIALARAHTSRFL